MNPVQNLLASHATVREFRDAPLDDRLVERAVRAAQQAATSSHVQAYGLLRIRDPQTRRRLAELCGGQPQVERAGAFFVLCADQRRHRRAAERHGRSYAPNLETFLVAVIDASLFAQNLVVAFESEGLGTCYIGGLRNRLPEVDALLELPEDVFGLYGLCVGHPERPGSTRPRLPLPAVLFEERYPDTAAMDRWVAEHDEVMAEEYGRRGKPGRNWSGGVARKFEEPRRVHLAKHYVDKGARLD